MIDFPCHCGYAFSLPDDLAGSMIQCPRCKLLVDIPVPSQANQFETDGTLKLQPPVPRKETEEERLASLKRAFLPGRVDENGEEIDLRTTMEQVEQAGVDHVPFEMKDELRPGPPKYDPETGELIQPLNLKAQPPQRVLPLPQGSSTLSYASDQSSQLPVPFYLVPLIVLKGGNGVVLMLVALLHALMVGTLAIAAGGMIFVGFAPILALLAIAAHYSNVVDDVGIEERDELPALLRQMSMGEDVWRPFCHFVGALILCYWPAQMLLNHHLPLLALVLAAVGSVFFPAVFLTLCTSGSVRNLRPDRVLSVMSQGGLDYVLSVGLWIAAATVYGPAIQSLIAMGLSFTIFIANNPVHALLPASISLLLLPGGIYLMHVFCWHLGLFYRARQAQFPWILRQHIRKTPSEPHQPASPRFPRSRPRRAAQPTSQPTPAAPPTSTPRPRISQHT